jgi:hypothetical protein
MCLILRKMTTNQWTHTQDINMATNKREGLFDPSIMYNQMNQQNLVPPRTNSMLGGAFGAYYPEYNFLVAPSIDNTETGLSKEDTRSTLSHESTHAWVSNVMLPIIDVIRNKENPTALEKQFLKASESLAGNIDGYDSYDKNPQAYKDYYKYIKKLEGTAEIDKARKNPKEVPAYAIGNMSAGKKSDLATELGVGSGGTHQDATIATDYSILMDFIDRLPNDTREKAADMRKQQIKGLEEHPKIKRMSSYSKAELANPFFTTDEFENPLLK